MKNRKLKQNERFVKNIDVLKNVYMNGWAHRHFDLNPKECDYKTAIKGWETWKGNYLDYLSLEEKLK